MTYINKKLHTVNGKIKFVNVYDIFY